MATVEEEARLRRELMVKESEACVAALMAAAIVAASAAAPAVPAGAQAWRPTVDKDNITSEVPPKIINITLRFAGLPQEEIVRIFQNKFKPINLYRLCHMHGLQFNAL